MCNTEHVTRVVTATCACAVAVTVSSLVAPETVGCCPSFVRAFRRYADRRMTGPTSLTIFLSWSGGSGAWHPPIHPWMPRHDPGCLGRGRFPPSTSPMSLEEIVEVIQLVFQERVQSRTVNSGTCPFPRFKRCHRSTCRIARWSRSWTSHRSSDRISSQTESCSVPWSRFLAVPAALLVEQLAKVPKFVSKDRIQQRTLEQISDTPFPHVVEELAVCPGFVWDLHYFSVFPVFPDFPAVRRYPGMMD